MYLQVCMCVGVRVCVREHCRSLPLSPSLSYTHTNTQTSMRRSQSAVSTLKPRPGAAKKSPKHSHSHSHVHPQQSGSSELLSDFAFFEGSDAQPESALLPVQAHGHQSLQGKSLCEKVPFVCVCVCVCLSFHEFVSFANTHTYTYRSH
jgi:hypothetical protein